MLLRWLPAPIFPADDLLPPVLGPELEPLLARDRGLLAALVADALARQQAPVGDRGVVAH